VKIKYQAAVYKLEKDNAGNISRVHFVNWTKESDYVEGKLVILAAHAIESAVLLLHNNLSNSSGLVGKNLMDHPQGYGVGVYRDPLYTFRGPPTTSGIDEFRDGDFRKDTAAFRISIGNDGWSRFVRKDNPKKLDNLEFLIEEKFGIKDFVIGKALREAIENKITRIFRFSYSTEMLPDESNRVELGSEIDPVTRLPRPRIFFKIDVADSYNNNAFQKAQRVLNGLFKTLGVPDNDFEVQGNNSIFSGAGHIMGTLRMGDEAGKSVVNANCLSHDHNNLYIIGSGLFPTSATANPTLTIAALALRLAEEISKRIKEKKA
ncbi:MAG TPA: GMC oxidoreductase, partial [Flavisolibacter sp.]|nr:GMC oxidoreductase [Flavisolibacter sp.]